MREDGSKRWSDSEMLVRDGFAALLAAPMLFGLSTVPGAEGLERMVMAGQIGRDEAARRASMLIARDAYLFADAMMEARSESGRATGGVGADARFAAALEVGCPTCGAYKSNPCRMRLGAEPAAVHEERIPDLDRVPEGFDR